MAMKAEGRLEDEDGCALAGEVFDQRARGGAANFFVGGPEEDEAMAEGEAEFADGAEGKERLDDAGLHVEDTGAVGFAAGDVEGHGLQCAGGVDGVVVT